MERGMNFDPEYEDHFEQMAADAEVLRLQAGIEENLEHVEKVTNELGIILAQIIKMILSWPGDKRPVTRDEIARDILETFKEKNDD